MKAAFPSFVVVALAVAFAPTAALAAPPARVAPKINAPDPGDEIMLPGPNTGPRGIDYSFDPVNGMTGYECKITQGGASFSETLGSASAGCSADRNVALSKFKPGAATLAVRSKVGERASPWTTIPVKFVAHKQEDTSRPCSGPKCNRSTPKPPEGGGPTVPTGKLGDARPESWDGDYRSPASVSGELGFVQCPTAEAAIPHDRVVVSKGEITFVTHLVTSLADDQRVPGRDPASIVKMTAKIAPDGTITGTHTLSAANLAYVSNIARLNGGKGPGGAGYKLENHKTFIIKGQALNTEALRGEQERVSRGRRVRVEIDNSATITKSSGAADPCRFVADASE